MEDRAKFYLSLYYTCSAYFVLLYSDLLVASVICDADFILDPSFLPLPVSPIAGSYCSHCFGHLFCYLNSILTGIFH